MFSYGWYNQLHTYISYPWDPNQVPYYRMPRKPEKERRPDVVTFNGKQWVNKPLAYYPACRTNQDRILKLTHMPAEILDVVFGYLDVQSLYNVCQIRFFKPFLNDYSTLNRFLNLSINDDLKAGRWELVVFKHRHGIKCGYSTSRDAMCFATRKRQWEFCKYLLSLGKTWNWTDLQSSLQTTNQLKTFLNTIKPDLKSPTLLYMILRIASVSSDPSMKVLVQMYFRNFLKQQIKFGELLCRTEYIATEYITDEAEAAKYFHCLRGNTLDVLKRFPNLWNLPKVKYEIFRQQNAAQCVTTCQYIMTYDDYIMALQLGNVNLIETVPHYLIPDLIHYSLQTYHEPCLEKLLHLYLHDTDSVTTKSRAIHLKTQFPQLANHHAIKRAHNWLYRLFNI